MVLACFMLVIAGLYNMTYLSSAFSVSQVMTQIVNGNSRSAIKEVENELGVNCNQILNNINADGTINESVFTQELKDKFFSMMTEAGFDYIRNDNGVYIITQKSSGKSWNIAQLKNKALSWLKNNNLDSDSNVEKSSVSENSRISTNADVITGNGVANRVTTSTDVFNNQIQKNNKEIFVGTALPIVKNYKLDESLRNAILDFGKMFESISDLTKEQAITLSLGNVKWIIENKGADLEKAKKFYFNSNVIISEFSNAGFDIPVDLKEAAKQKSNVAVHFCEKNNRNLPFNGKVIVNLDSKYVNKKMDVYYIFDGKSYKCGQVVINKQNQVVLLFKAIGDFVLIESN